MARPSIYTDEVLTEICERLSNGEPMAVICRDDHMPSVSTVHNWQNDPNMGAQVSASIARAREDGFDMLAWEGKTIVDTLEEDPASRRVRSDYRLKLLSKWDPKRYGDKQQVEHSGSVNLGQALDVLPD